MSHDDLVNYYRTNHILQSIHGFSIQVLENMMPWERLVYTDLIAKKIENDKRLQTDMANANRDIQNLMNKVGRS